MEKALFAEFPPVTDEQWRQQVVQDLKGANPETLLWGREDGIEVKPYYRKSAAAGKIPVPAKGDNTWAIREDIVVGDPKTANPQALNALQAGATALGFVCHNGADFKVLLKEVLLEHIQSDWRFAALPQLDAFVQYLAETGQDPNNIHGSVVVDGVSCIKLFDVYHAQLPNLKLLVVGVSGKETLAEQIAQQLSLANDMVQALIATGVSAADVLGNVVFQIAVSTDYFFEIARIRALRALWQVVCRQYMQQYDGLATIYASNKKTLPEKDGYYEMIRQTTQALSAVIGGADTVALHPMVQTTDKAPSFQARIARNIQLILQHESNLHRIADPAAGSWYLEDITLQLATQAWDKFVASSQNQ